MIHGLPAVRRAVRHSFCPFSAPIASRQPFSLPKSRHPGLLQLRRTYYHESVPLSPARPPRPDELPKPKLKPKPDANSAPKQRRRRRLRNFLLFSLVALPAGYLIDRSFYASSLTRSCRTFGYGILIGFDYKINFRAHPFFYHSVEELHSNNARRIFELLRENGGLYLKIGQAIAMQSAVLPPEFQRMFARMFDDAPQNEWQDVERVVREDFGKSVEDVFGVSFAHGREGVDGKGNGVMERRARASASVAQVHWARLKDGREVAVKIQKREIDSQVGWDLWAFKVVSRVYSWWFDIPIYTLVPYITERLQLETDFENEAHNSIKMAEYIRKEPRLRNRVYIPTVYKELSSKRVMTAEWIEGVRLWDKDGITKSWYGGYGQGSPGAGGSPLPPVSPTAPTSSSGDDNPDVPPSARLKPDRTSWKGKTRTGGLGLSLHSVMQTMVDLFSAQMFLFGLVHCDPHPGNIFIRRLPNGKPEIVLIDHGLYIQMSPQFRHQYANFWKALISFDNDKIREVVSSWGVKNADIFASATLMRPYEGGDLSTANSLGMSGEDWVQMDEQERAYIVQQKMRKGVRQILGDESKWPRELIFIGRNLRIVQGNNQFLGSPVNRIKITGLWASRALADSKDLSWTQRVGNWGRHLMFRGVLWMSDAVWWWARVRQMLGLGGGMEEELESRMRKMAKGFGVELNHGVFEG